MLLSKLCEKIKFLHIEHIGNSTPLENLEITGIIHDSRKAEQGNLILAPVDFYLPGETVYSEKASDLFLQSIWKKLDTKIKNKNLEKIFQLIENSISNNAGAIILPAFLQNDLLQQLKKSNSEIISQIILKWKKNSNSFTLLFVEDYYNSQGEMSRRFYHYPDEKLHIVGVSGTNGKTSTTNILYQLFKNGNQQTASLGTLGLLYDDTGFQDVGFTTPIAPLLYKILAEAVERGITHFVLELSSHAFTLGRFAGLQLNGLILTTIGQDHLDFHGSMASYIDAKFSILKHLRNSAKQNKTFVCGQLSQDVKNSFKNYLNKNNFLKRETGQDNIKFIFLTKNGKEENKLELTSSIVIHQDNKELSIPKSTVHLYSKTTEIHLSVNILIFPGALFHIDNSVNAWLYTYFTKYHNLSSISDDLVKTTTIDLLNLKPVPGRFELIQIKKEKFKNCWAIIDYAHTHDAIESLLESIKVFNFKSVIIVFGCGGDRDKAKRPLMAKAASKFANKIIITSDNPRTENPQQIIKDIEKGMEQKKYSSQVDRREAIKLAYKNITENEILVIAGKGHEDYQIIAKEKFHFSDKEEILKLDIE